MRVGVGHDQCGGLCPFRADGPDYVGPFVTGIAWGAGTGATLGPNADKRTLLTNARFVLEPNLKRLAAGGFRENRLYLSREVFL